MSDAQQPQVLDPDTAYGFVSQQIYTPVFFQKLSADFGIVPGSRQEAVDMLSMASQLRAKYDQEMEKSASSQGSVLAAAQAHLSETLGVEVGDGGAIDGEIDKLAAQISANPEIAHAVLSLQLAAASEQ